MNRIFQAPDDSDGQEAKESTTASKWALTFFWKYLENALGKKKSDEVCVWGGVSALSKRGACVRPCGFDAARYISF